MNKKPSTLFSGKLPRPALVILLTLGLLISAAARADTDSPFEIGVFEAGNYAWFSLLRTEFTAELENLGGDSIRVVFPADRYYNAEWNRESSRSIAAGLIEAEPADLLVTFGPWVVEDLLAAGYEGPILALHRFDPVAEGLLDSTGRAVAENLTVSVAPERYIEDLNALTSIISVKKLGVLFFPSEDETERVLEHIRRSADALGIEIFSADGRIPDGRYAFFKAYQNLPKDIDALYLGPLWALTPDMMREFFAQCRRDRLPTLSAEGRFHVTRGAMASYAGQTATVEGTVAAVKAVQILRGTGPSDLNTLMPVQTGWSINEQSAVACGVEVPEYLKAVAEIEPAPPCDTCELYTVSRALGQALSAHPGPLAAYAALDAAEHSVGEAISALLPGLEVTGAAGWVDDNTVNNRVPEASNEQYRLGVHLDQTIFSLAAIRAIRTAREAARLGELDAARARLDLEKAVILAYVNVLHAEALMNAEISVRRFIDRFREHAEVRQLLGLDESDAAVRWKSARNEAVARVARARTNKAIAEMLLRSLLVIAPETSVSLDSQLFAASGMVADFAYAELHSTTAADDEVFAVMLADRALVSNPSLESARAALAVKRGEGSVNAAEWIPKIGFRASFEMQDELADRPGLFEEKTPTWAVGASLSWRLFDGGARQKRGSALKAEALSLELRRDSTVLNVRNRVRQLASSYVHTLRNGAHLAEAVMGAEVYARRMAERVSDPLLVQLDAVEHYRATTLEVLINRFNHHRIAAELIGLIGWSMSERNSYPTVVLSDLLRSAMAKQ